MYKFIKWNLSILLNISFLRIPLETTRGQTKQSKVRFLCCKDGHVYTSDMGLGQLYVTKLKNMETIVCTYHKDGANRLKNAMGVSVDPAGNLTSAAKYV